MKLLYYSLFLFLITSCFGNKQHTNLQETESRKTSKLVPDFDKSSQMIDETIFWKVIDKAFANDDSYTSQRKILLEELAKLSPKDIVGFNLRTTKILSQSYSPDLWCAAYIMKGGCSDDGFEYFRCWLISKGENTFHKAVKHPDSLSELDSKPFYFDYELEELLYLPNEAFMNKTGREIYDFIDYDIFYKNEISYSDLEFTWQEDDTESMKKICPKLYDKF